MTFVEEANAKRNYDLTADIMSDAWDPRAAFRTVRAFPRAEIADLLLDQNIFAGVGNIIKNEVLFRTRTSPSFASGKISDRKLKAVIADARVFSLRFLALRRIFALRKHLEIYQRSVCPRCGRKVFRLVHGARGRRSFFCAHCQKVPKSLRKPRVGF